MRRKLYAEILVIGMLGLAVAGAPKPNVQNTGAATSATISMKKLYPYGVDNGSRTFTTGNATTVPLTQFFSYRYSYTGEKEKYLITAVLDRKVGSGSWKAVTSQSFNLLTSGGKVSVQAPKFSTSSKSTTVYYRVRFTHASGKSTSKTLTTVYHNQKKYSGSEKVAYDAMKKYCPSVAVVVADKATMGKSYKKSTGLYKTGQNVIYVNSRTYSWKKVKKSSKVKQRLRETAVHECAHSLQWTNWGSTSSGYKKMEKAMDKRFATSKEERKIDPVEHAADCAAKSVYKKASLPYGGSCSKTELEYAKMILQRKTWK